MKFKVDENLPQEAAEALRGAGYEASTVLEQQLGGAKDSDVASVCRVEGRVLVTLDTDFADIRTYPPSDYPGLIVMRLKQSDKPHVLEIMTRLLPLLKFEPLKGHLWIVEEERVRTRE
jgi:predicted nuclease of predicted toxin-antitoxin system